MEPKIAVFILSKFGSAEGEYSLPKWRKATAMAKERFPELDY